MKIRVINEDIVKKIVKISFTKEILEKSYVSKYNKNVEIFPYIFKEFQTALSDFYIKSAYFKEYNFFAHKTDSWFSYNSDENLDPNSSNIILYSSLTGYPLAFLSAKYISGMRTAVAGALAAKLLARKDSKTMLIVGAGFLAKFQISACLELMPEINEVLIYDGLSHEKAEKLADAIQENLDKNLFNYSDRYINFSPTKDIETSSKKSDIIITVTPSFSPIIKNEWVKKGTHFSTLGADMLGRIELDPLIFKDARIFVDDIDKSIELGELEFAYNQKLINRDNISGEIGELILKPEIGRQNDDEISIYDNTGAALSDLLIAWFVYQYAEKENLGQIIDL